MSYNRYLKLGELLSLQRQDRGGHDEHDELLFIVIHQVYELWFKLLLHELDKAKGDLEHNRVYATLATFHRCRMVMKTLVGQLDILETMTPLSFKNFRQMLERASGLQSCQFREFEFLMGYKRPEVIALLARDDPGVERVKQRLQEPSLVDAMYEFLSQRGVRVPEALRQRDPSAAAVPNEELQAGILDLYRNHEDVRLLFEAMTDFDEGQQEWRYRHVKIVERTIGSNPGTGGSLGVEFLKKSLFKPVFADLWAIRHQL